MPLLTLPEVMWLPTYTEVDATEVLIPDDSGITLDGGLHESCRLWFAPDCPNQDLPRVTA